MAFERQTSDGRQIEHLRNGGDEGTYTFLTTMYHGISSMRSLERSRNKDGGVEGGGEKRGRKRHKQETQTKRSHFDENFAAWMFPVKGNARRVWCLAFARHLQRLSLCKEAKCKRLCVYGINGWRRSPAGERKPALNQRALCSEAPRQTEAFPG